MTRRRMLWQIFVSYVFVLVASILISVKGRATSYEISLYDAYGFSTWVFLAAGFILGFVNTIALTKKESTYKALALAGSAPMILCAFARLVVPFARGYPFFGRYDDMVHFGYVKDIVSAGVVGPDNLNPLDHIEAATLFLASSGSLSAVFRIVPVAATFGFILSAFVLSRRLAGKGSGAFALTIPCILLFGHESIAFAPSVQGFLMTPCLLFAVILASAPSSRIPGRICSAFLAVALVMFHPEVTLLVAMILLLVGLPRLVLKRRSTSDEKLEEAVASEFSYQCARTGAIALVLFFAWYMYSVHVLKNLGLVATSIFRGFEGSQFAAYSDIVQSANVPWYGLAQVGLIEFGIPILLLAPLIYLAISRTEGGTASSVYHMRRCARFFLIPLIFLCVLSVAAFFLDVIIGFGRVAKYLVLVELLVSVCAYSVWHSNRQRIRRHISPRILVLNMIIILILLVSMMNTYWSPLVRKANEQVSNSEIAGIEFLFQHGESNIEMKGFIVSLLRFHWFIYGKANEPLTGVGSIDRPGPMDHFGYNVSDTYGSQLRSDQYLVVNSLGRMFYGEVYPEYQNEWRFNPVDFEKLENDPTVSKILDNPDVSIYFVDL